MIDRDRLETLFRKHGLTDFRWITPEHIVVAQWVRMKCAYGCVEYGKNACCPPNVPAVDECERFFREYSDAAIFHFEKTVDKPEDRFAWTREVNLDLLKLEQGAGGRCVRHGPKMRLSDRSALRYVTNDEPLRILDGGIA